MQGSKCQLIILQGLQSVAWNIHHVHITNHACAGALAAIQLHNTTLQTVLGPRNATCFKCEVMAIMIGYNTDVRCRV